MRGQQHSGALVTTDERRPERKVPNSATPLAQALDLFGHGENGVPILRNATEIARHGGRDAGEVEGGLRDHQPLKPVLASCCRVLRARRVPEVGADLGLNEGDYPLMQNSVMYGASLGSYVDFERQ